MDDLHADFKALAARRDEKSDLIVQRRRVDARLGALDDEIREIEKRVYRWMQEQVYSLRRVEDAGIRG